MTQNKDTSNSMSQQQVITVTGFGYLMVFIVGIFANFFALDKLIVQGDTITTFNNIVSNQSLFRFGIAGWLFVIVCDTLVAWGLYILLKPVNKSISLIAAWFRLVFVAIFACSFINHLSILNLVNNSDYLKVFGQNQLQTQMMILLNAQQNGLLISYVFFGFHIFFLGYLILKSNFIPRVLGIMLIVASVGYQINSFGNLLSTDYANYKLGFILTVAIPAGISELSFTVWLLYRGLKRTKIRSEIIQ